MTTHAAPIRAAALLLAAALFCLLPLARPAAADDGDAAAAPRKHTIRVKGMAFIPATLEVRVGDEIVWVNEDLVPHTATAIVDGETIFDSGVFPAKASWSWVASKAGTIPYVCLLHPTMKADLIVR